MPDLSTLLPRAEWHFGNPSRRERSVDNRYLVTGAGGSIGWHLADRLAAENPDQLVLVDSHEPSLFRLREHLRRFPGSARFRYCLVDVRNTTKLETIVRDERPQVVFSLAAYKHVPLAEENADQVLSVNVEAAIRLAELSERFGVERFVYPSTDKAVRPPSIYGATKRVAELSLLSLGIQSSSRRFAVARLVNVLGSQGGVIETFKRQILAGGPVTLTDPGMTRYWMTVQEAVGLLRHAGHINPTGTAFMVDVGKAVQVIETAQLLQRAMRPELSFRFEVLGARPGERLHEELLYSYERATRLEIDGLLRIDSDGVPGDSRAFLSAVENLIRRAPAMTSASIKAALFDLASQGPAT
ncbi:MAG TPA: polysaccharide biosynthesis protein [Chloroflexota bacterium]|nr:polysaccharide biosynthesis protein [Chloroflexota bacterium]